MHAGLVDLATLSVVNLYLAQPSAPTGDWLIVHMRPEATSIVIMRGGEVIFYRNRAEGDEDALTDVVHQTTMYYQDRLSGQGFTRVLLGGAGRTIGAAAVARHSLEERLATPVEPIDPTQDVMLGDRVQATPELMSALAPVIGMLLRTRREMVGV
jgi:Tfp pilus assembly PilM family ATPase